MKLWSWQRKPDGVWWQAIEVERRRTSLQTLPLVFQLYVSIFFYFLSYVVFCFVLLYFISWTKIPEFFRSWCFDLKLISWIASAVKSVVVAFAWWCRARLRLELLAALRDCPSTTRFGLLWILALDIDREKSMKIVESKCIVELKIISVVLILCAASKNWGGAWQQSLVCLSQRPQTCGAILESGQFFATCHNLVA